MNALQEKKSATANSGPDMNATAEQVARDRTTVGLFLMDGFNLFEVSIVFDLLSLANREQEETEFVVELFARAPGMIRSASGICLKAEKSVEEFRADLVVIPGTETMTSPPNAVVWEFRKILLRARRVAALGECAVAFCKSGLIRSGTASVPSNHEPALKERFPDVEFRQTLFEANGRLVTCKGGSLLLDFLVCWLIEEAVVDRRVSPAHEQLGRDLSGVNIPLSA